MPAGRTAPVPEIIPFPVGQDLEIPEQFPQGAGGRGVNPRSEGILSALEDMLEHEITARTDRILQAGQEKKSSGRPRRGSLGE